MDALQPGDPRRAGPYVLLGRLGAGGMGQVFLGRSPGGRRVAVKVIRPEMLAAQPDFRVRFAREVAAAKRVNALFTAPVVDADPDGAMPWLVTAYVPGPSLADAVSEHGPLRAGDVRALAAGLAEGLAAIHSVGVVHRDLKPSNVLLAEDGPRIIDFGISRAADVTGLTGTGWLLGTPAFMSPEQAEGRPAGPASDIFSLGSVLAFAATGEAPFRAGTVPGLLYQIAHAQPAIAGVPGELRRLVAWCLAKDPASRPSPEHIVSGLGPAGLLRDWLPPAVAATLPRYHQAGLGQDQGARQAPPQTGFPPAAPDPGAGQAATETGFPPGPRDPGAMHAPPGTGFPPGPRDPGAMHAPPGTGFPPGLRDQGGRRVPPGTGFPPAMPDPGAGRAPGRPEAAGRISNALPPECRIGWLSVPVLGFLVVATFVAPIETGGGLFFGFLATLVVSRIWAAVVWVRGHGAGELPRLALRNLASDGASALGLGALAFATFVLSAEVLLPAVGPGPAQGYINGLLGNRPEAHYAFLRQAWYSLHLAFVVPVAAVALVALLRRRGNLRQRPLVLPRLTRYINTRSTRTRLIAAAIPVAVAIVLVVVNGGLSPGKRPSGATCVVAPATCNVAGQLIKNQHSAGHPRR